MKKLDILSKKEIKGIISMIEKQWGGSPPFDYVILKNNKDKLYIVNKTAFPIDDKSMRIDSIGLYFGAIVNNELRLSIEGSQMIGPFAKKNVIELDDKQFANWIRGIEFDIPHENSTFCIIKNKNDYIGTGKVRDHKMLNYYPKSRRIMSAN